MLFAQINTKEMLMFEDYFDPDDDYDDDGYDEDDGFGDDGDDDEGDYDDYGDAGDGGDNGGGKSDKGADNDESGYGDDTGDGFGEETREKTIEEDIAERNEKYNQEIAKDQAGGRWEGDTNANIEDKKKSLSLEDIKVSGKAEGGPKGKAAEEKLAKKNATRWSSLLGIPVGIRAVGTCPGCGKKTIYQSMTAIDLIIFKAILSLTKSPLNVYFCMNSGKNCRLSFEKGMCWMCAGKFEPTTMPVPYPLKLFRFNK